jgi:hypothetical protein
MEVWMATASGNQISTRNRIRGTVGELKAGQATTWYISMQRASVLCQRLPMKVFRNWA